MFSKIQTVLKVGSTYAFFMFCPPEAEALSYTEAESKIAQTLTLGDVSAFHDTTIWGNGVIVISKEKMELTLFDAHGKVVYTFPVACGKMPGNKRRRDDNCTPEGHFSISGIQNSSWWTHDFHDGKGQTPGAYGHWFFRLDGKFTGIGIHGTHAPSSIGTRASEGCIRLQNTDLELLKPRIKIGMPVYIIPGKEDLDANQKAAIAAAQKKTKRK